MTLVSITSRASTSVLLLGTAIAFTAAPVRAGTLYAISRDLDEVYVIDTSTGAATLVGTAGDNIGGIAFDGTGSLHGVDRDIFDMALWQLDPGTATATWIAGTGGPGGEGALAYDPTSNRFYSKWHGLGGGVTQELISIEPVTGAVTFIGNLGLALESDINGMAVLSDGTLLAFDHQSLLPSVLLEIDKTTAAVTVIGGIGDAAVTAGTGGLAYDPETDTLYMSNGTELWTVDPLTGAGTFVGLHGAADIVSGLAVLPGPYPSCMIGLDLTSTLFDVDPLSGAGSDPRRLGAGKFGGLAMSPLGQLFALKAAPIPELYTVDLYSGAATLIGSLGIAHEEGGLDFDPLSGDLFGVGGASELLRIDPITGAATIVGPLVDELGNPIDPSAVAFDAAGTLFVLKATSTPPEIYRVDPLVGTVFARVPLPGLPFDSYGGMDFDDTTGILYLAYGNQLYRANPYTGATVLLGPTPVRSALEVLDGCGTPGPLTPPASFLRSPPPVP